MTKDAFFNAAPSKLSPMARACATSLLAMMTLLVTGCVDGPSSAQIVDRSVKNPERSKSPVTARTTTVNNSSTSTSTTTSKSPARTEPATSDADNGATSARKSSTAEPLPLADGNPPGYYTVKNGDTLLKIAEKFSRRTSELTEWNALPNPNAIREGQVLRIAPPDTTQIASVPVDTDMEIRRAGRPVKPSTASQVSSRAVPLHKTTPLGQKIAYSEKAIADLERGEPSPVRALDLPKKQADLPPSSSRFIWPTDGKVVSAFNASRKGIDIAGKIGQPVVAAGDGKVLYAKNMRGYGNLIILEHGDSMVTAYAHNKTILVREGQMVTQRQQIAEMGDSDADTVKLRFQVRHMGKPIDPISLLPPADAASSSAR